MNDKPFFSVIIPTYNRAELLGRAVKSVVEQQFQDFEVIVVNDGSTQGLEDYDKIKQHYSENHKIIFFEKANAGLSAARNSGIGLSKAQFVCFLDDDDYYLDNHLQELHKLILEKKAEVGIYRTFTLFKESEDKTVPQEIVRNSTAHPVVYVLWNLITSNNVCIERSIFKNYLFSTKVRIAEDYEMWVKVLVDYPLFETYVHTTVYDRTRETMSAGSVTNYFRYIDTFELIFSNPGTVGIIKPEFIKDKYEKFYSWIIEEYLRANDLASFAKMKLAIKKHVGSGFYYKNYLRFIKKRFTK